MYEIRFPNLGIHLKKVLDGFYIGNFQIHFYGVIIALGFMLAYVLISREAKRTKQNEEMYLDFILWLVIPAIIGARIYYVLFSLDDYIQEGRSLKDTLFALINIRGGGLAIYGGVIAGLITLFVFAKRRKVSAARMLDTCCMGLLAGQIIGRWGNFFNREAFGEYTDSLLAMGIPVEWFGGRNYLLRSVNNGVITQKMIDNVVNINGNEFIQVHPTFLYESLWNLGVLLIIYLYRRYKKFDGELFAMYVWGYGLGRVWIEALRTDSLMLFNSFRVSQLLAAVCVLSASIYVICKRIRLKNVMEDERIERDL